ncbi:MAG: shikimate kinase [Acidimicrobiales bacterium]
MADRLLLVGMMGAGKSTVARLAARSVGWKWLDVDEMVSREAGASVPELFARHGESYFRRQESRALQSVLGGDEDVIVSVGGGAVLDEANRARLAEGGEVVWLRARPETLMARVRDGAGRPLLDGTTPEQRMQTLRRIDAERRPIYGALARHVVDVDGLDAASVARRVLEAAGLNGGEGKAHP